MNLIDNDSRKRERKFDTGEHIKLLILSLPEENKEIKRNKIL